MFNQLILLINQTLHINLLFFDNHIFVVGDNALINDVQCSIISLISSKEVLVKGAGELSSNTVYKIQRLLSKANLSNYPSANIFSTNIQNSYSDGNQNTYIASPSIPNYFNEALDIRKTDIIFSGSFNNSTEITIPSHGLITGEKVTYVGGSGDNKLDITQDEYFIKKIDVNTIKLSKSSANINNNVFVSFSGSVSDNIFKISNFYQKNIKSQKLLRKIHASIPSKFSNPTRTGKTGILVNGVETC